MKNKLRQWWGDLQASLWFVPGLFVIASIWLAVGLVEVDVRIKGELLRNYPRLFGAGAEGSRGMLTTIAASMMTAVSVSFSITLAALAQASSQYTPRILRNFMRSRTTQVTLGILAGIFAYCLIVLRTVRGSDELQFVPSLAILFGFVLALIGVGALIFFIHHAAISIQASHLIAAVSEETIAAIDQLFPRELGEDLAEDEPHKPPAGLETLAWQTVLATRTGYVQSVDSDALLQLAGQSEAIIKLECRIGDFVIAETPLAVVALSRPVDSAFTEKLNNLINLHRTVEQDAGFGIRQLVDVALKALSPGVNDTTTAITCIDYLTAILVRLAPRRIPSPYRYEGEHLRVIAVGPTFERMLVHAFTQIRCSADSNLAVILRLLRCLETIAASTQSPARRQALQQQLEVITELIEHGNLLAHDRLKLEAARDHTARVLRQPPTVRPDAVWPEVRTVLP
jgi:uncharacterized membrane protein